MRTLNILTNKNWKTLVTARNYASSTSGPKEESERMKEFKKKIREKTPIGKLDEIEGAHPYAEKEPLKPWPGGVNPETGERNGPAGPEPTRYGDWERKGRVSDF